MPTRFYDGRYYGPRFVDEGPRVDVGQEIAAAIEGYVGHRRQAERDRREQEEHEYQIERRKTLDPLEEALLESQLHERGVVRAGREGGKEMPSGDVTGAPPGSSSIADVLDEQRGGDAIVRSQRGAQAAARIASGIAAPGSFNPVSGTFNAPMAAGRPQMDFRPEDRRGRIPLGGGFELDPALTTEGRRRGREDELIEALVRSGVPRDEATVEVRSGLEGAISEHLHPGPYHPRTREEALSFLDEELTRRGRYERSLIGAREPAARERRAISQWTEAELMNAAKTDDLSGDALYGEEVRQAALDELQRRLGPQRTPPTAPPINVPPPRQSGTAGGRTYRPENPFR